MKQGENDLNVQCRMVCTALANFPRYNNFLCLNPLRVHHVAQCRCKICVLCVHKQGLAPTSRPRNMSIGYADLYSTKARKTNIRSYNKPNKKKTTVTTKFIFQNTQFATVLPVLRLPLGYTSVQNFPTQHFISNEATKNSMCNETSGQLRAKNIQARLRHLKVLLFISWFRKPYQLKKKK